MTMARSSGTVPEEGFPSGGELHGGRPLAGGVLIAYLSWGGVSMTDLRRDVEEFYAGFTAGDFDRAFRIFAEDVVTVEPSLGRSAFLGEWRAYDEAFKAASPTPASCCIPPLSRVIESRPKARSAARSPRRCAPRCGNYNRRDARSMWRSPTSSASAGARSSSTRSTTTRSPSESSSGSSHRPDDPRSNAHGPDVRRECLGSRAGRFRRKPLDHA